MFLRGDAAVFATNTISSTATWTNETGSGYGTKIAAGGNGTHMYNRYDAAVFGINGIGTGWTQETSSYNGSKIAAGSSYSYHGAGIQMFIRGDGAVFASSSVGTTWTQETDSYNAIAIASG
jgi:hypothetical protein